MWDNLFGLTNVVAVIAWAVLLFLPRRPLTNSLVMYAGVGLLCLVYAVLLVLVVTRSVDPLPLPGATPFNPSDYSIEGLRRIFMSDGGLVVGWTHYLALDLFAGLWIARDADAKGFGRLIQAPVLLLTFLAGPVGLLVWLFLRERRARIGTKSALRK